MGFINSIFDDEDYAGYNLWRKDFKGSSFLTEKVTICTPLFKKGKVSKEIEEKVFTLAKDCLFYKASHDDNKIRGWVDQTFVRLEFISKSITSGDDGQNDGESKTQQLKGFRLLRNLKYTDIYTDSEENYKQWTQALCQITIQTNFHETFKIVAKIGRGSFAKVYLVNQYSTNENYACKAFNKNYQLSQRKGKESLINEIEILSQVDHPNCIKYINCYESAESLYIIMEYFDGKALFDSKNNESYNHVDIAVIMRTLLETLVYFNDILLMHRDQKAENILVARNEKGYTIKFIDFGLSTFLDCENVIYKRCGTPGFTAPEVLNSSSKKPLSYDCRCDIYSIGVIFYYLLSGFLPYKGQTFESVIAKNKMGMINFNSQELKDVEKIPHDLLKNMLYYNSELRYTAAQCLKHPYFNKTETKRRVSVVKDSIRKINVGKANANNEKNSPVIGKPVEIKKTSQFFRIRGRDLNDKAIATSIREPSPGIEFNINESGLTNNDSIIRKSFNINNKNIESNSFDPSKNDMIDKVELGKSTNKYRINSPNIESRGKSVEVKSLRDKKLKATSIRGDSLKQINILNDNQDKKMYNKKHYTVARPTSLHQKGIGKDYDSTKNNIFSNTQNQRIKISTITENLADRQMSKNNSSYQKNNEEDLPDKFIYKKDSKKILMTFPKKGNNDKRNILENMNKSNPFVQVVTSQKKIENKNIIQLEDNMNYKNLAASVNNSNLIISEKKNDINLILPKSNIDIRNSHEFKIKSSKFKDSAINMGKHYLN